METKPETFGVPTLITELSQPSKARAVGPQIITPLLSACYGQTIMRNATHGDMNGRRLLALKQLTL